VPRVGLIDSPKGVDFYANVLYFLHAGGRFIGILLEIVRTLSEHIGRRVAPIRPVSRGFAMASVGVRMVSPRSCQAPVRRRLCDVVEVSKNADRLPMTGWPHLRWTPSLAQGDLKMGGPARTEPPVSATPLNERTVPMVPHEPKKDDPRPKDARLFVGVTNLLVNFARLILDLLR
jgi:hypothetical protein